MQGDIFTACLDPFAVTGDPVFEIVVVLGQPATASEDMVGCSVDSHKADPTRLLTDPVLPWVGDNPARQCARTPYTASFSRNGSEFTLASVHILWGTSPGERLPEVTASAQWMRDYAVRPTGLNSNLIVLGDFHLERMGVPLYEAFISTGLWPQAEVNTVPRTIFDDDKTRRLYDQLAWFSKADGTSLRKGLTCGQRAETFDFIRHVFRGLSRSGVSWRISDHYPL
jgi:hypothetical protein